MKRGEQAKLIRELESEHGLKVSKTIISRMVKEKDYRIILTPKKDINISKTVKALLDSDFPERVKKVSDTLAARKGKPAKTIKAKKSADKPEEETETGSRSDVDISNYIDDNGRISTRAPRNVIDRYKNIQAAEKDRIKNETSLKTLVSFSDITNKVFDFLRPLRDDIQDVAKRVSAIVYQTGSKREAEKVINDEINRILLSRIGTDYKFDDDLKKKIIKALTT